METETIVKAIIIVIVIIFLVLIPTKGWPIVKTLLNMDEDIIPQVTPESVKQEFQNIVSNYEECFNSQDNNCLCDMNLLMFPTHYFLLFATKNSLIISRSESNGQISAIESHMFPNENINCYVNIQTKNNIKIVDIPEAYIPLSFSPRVLLKQKQGNDYDNELPTGLFSRSKVHQDAYKMEDYQDIYNNGYEVYLFYSPMFYKKDNNICFIIASQLSAEGKKYIDGLSKCK